MVNNGSFKAQNLMLLSLQIGRRMFRLLRRNLFVEFRFSYAKGFYRASIDRAKKCLGRQRHYAQAEACSYFHHNKKDEKRKINTNDEEINWFFSFFAHFFFVCRFCFSRGQFRDAPMRFIVSRGNEKYVYWMAHEEESLNLLFSKVFCSIAYQLIVCRGSFSSLDYWTRVT